MPLFLITCFCLGTLALSWVRFRDLLHPHFVFTLSWVFLLPGSVLVEPDLPDYLLGAEGIPKDELVRYNLIILCTLTGVFVLTLFSPANLAIRSSRETPLAFMLPVKYGTAAAALGLLLLLVEWGKQLYFCSWSLPTWISWSLAPRFGRPWGVEAVGGTDYFRRLSSVLFQLAPLLLTMALFHFRSVGRAVIGSAWALAIAIQVCGGSRTPVAFSFACFALVGIAHAKSKAAKRVFLIAASVATVAASATILSMRGVGLGELRSLPGERPPIKYGQDDNYYRLLAILHTDRRLADGSLYGGDAHWNGWQFLAAVLANPIPRYFWAGKPLLTEEFYGVWKLDYVTVSWMGELVAIMGTFWGLVAAVCVAYLLYLLLAKAHAATAYSFGAFLYLSVAFYVYMALRSLHNVGMYMLFAGAALVIFALLRGRPGAPEGTPDQTA